MRIITGIHSLFSCQLVDYFQRWFHFIFAFLNCKSEQLLFGPIGYYNQSLAPSLYKALSCQKAPRYEKIPDLRTSRSDRFLHEKMTMCFFPGAPFFKSTSRILRLEKEVSYFIISRAERTLVTFDCNSRLKNMPYWLQSVRVGWRITASGTTTVAQLVLMSFCATCLTCLAV